MQIPWAYIHLVLNHFPVILATVGAIVALLAAVRPRRALWLYAAVSLTLAGITVIPTYFTGEPAADSLNRPWFIARGAIHLHEESALISVILVVLAGIMGAVVWRRVVRYASERSLPLPLRAGLVVLSLAALASIGWTSMLGGNIYHDSSILNGPRPEGVPAPVQGPPREP